VSYFEKEIFSISADLTIFFINHFVKENIWEEGRGNKYFYYRSVVILKGCFKDDDLTRRSQLIKFDYEITIDKTDNNWYQLTNWFSIDNNWYLLISFSVINCCQLNDVTLLRFAIYHYLKLVLIDFLIVFCINFYQKLINFINIYQFDQLVYQLIYQFYINQTHQS